LFVLHAADVEAGAADPDEFFIRVEAFSDEIADQGVEAEEDALAVVLADGDEFDAVCYHGGGGVVVEGGEGVFEGEAEVGGAVTEGERVVEVCAWPGWNGLALGGGRWCLGQVRGEDRQEATAEKEAGFTNFFGELEGFGQRIEFGEPDVIIDAACFIGQVEKGGVGIANISGEHLCDPSVSGRGIVNDPLLDIRFETAGMGITADGQSGVAELEEV